MNGGKRRAPASFRWQVHYFNRRRLGLGFGDFADFGSGFAGSGLDLGSADLPICFPEKVMRIFPYRSTLTRIDAVSEC